MTMKYPIDNGPIWVIKGDQEVARNYYRDNLKVNNMAEVISLKPNSHSINFVDFNTREKFMMPTENLKTMQIGSQSFQTTKIRTSLSMNREGIL